jgi:hypothetical protein
VSGSSSGRTDPSEGANQVVGNVSETPVQPTQGQKQTLVEGEGPSDTQTQEPGTIATADVVVLDNEEAEVEAGQAEAEVEAGTTKRQKRCTSIVWKYFTKHTEIVEINGKKYEQLWGYCNFPNCKQRYRAECNYGTTGFRNHLKSAHSVVKGQLQLKAEKDHGKDITNIQPYKYDQEVSVKKMHLAIIMHEYPFNIVEHEYFVDFIKSLRPSFPFKSRVTARNEIMDIYLEQKDNLYAYLKTVPSRFSATMDMWTSCQNKGYMCVTLHWIDDEWRIQKRIVGFFHVEGRHTGHKLAESFTEVMVNWFVEKRLFALTLDNAAANKVAVTDIIIDLKENGNASLVCDDIFFHIRCACHILNFVVLECLECLCHPGVWSRFPPVSVVFSSVFNRFRRPVYPASRPAPAPITGEIIWDGRRLRHFPFVFVRFHRYS